MPLRVNITRVIRYLRTGAWTIRATANAAPTRGAEWGRKTPPVWTTRPYLADFQTGVFEHHTLFEEAISTPASPTRSRSPAARGYYSETPGEARASAATGPVALAMGADLAR